MMLPIMSDQRICWPKTVKASALSQVRALTGRLPACSASRAPSSRSTYLAMTSTSRLTGSPGCLRPSVVRARVVGMRLTVK